MAQDVKQRNEQTARKKAPSWFEFLERAAEETESISNKSLEKTESKVLHSLIVILLLVVVLVQTFVLDVYILVYITDWATTGLSALVFFALAMGHSWANRHSHRYVYVTLLCTETALDIVDTVNLMSLIYTYRSAQIQVNVEVSHVEYFILVLCLISFLLPAIPLYLLSMTDKTADVLELPISNLNDILHLLFTDIPYVCFRAFLLQRGDNTVFIFMVKNILFIVVLLRRIIPDLRENIRRWRYTHKVLQKRKKRKKREKEQKEREGIDRKSKGKREQRRSSDRDEP